jgi:hypothetical protein
VRSLLVSPEGAEMCGKHLWIYLRQMRVLIARKRGV